MKIDNEGNGHNLIDSIIWSETHPDGKWEFALDPNQEYIIAFTGVRGGGKSLSASYLIFCDWLAHGRKVWSNIPIGGKLYYQGQEKVLASHEFEAEMLWSFDENLRNGAVFIDEANYYIDSRRSTSNKNLLFGDLAQQIRKRKMSLIFTVQFEGWLEYRIRQMLDLCCRCQDRYRLDLSYGKGETIDINVEDWSGIITGKPFQYTNENATEISLMAKKAWGIYNTENIVDIWEARQGVEVHQERVQLNVGRNKIADALQERFGDIEANIKEAMSRHGGEIKSHDLWREMGISDRGDQTAIGSIMSNMGIESRKNWEGKKIYADPELIPV